MPPLTPSAINIGSPPCHLPGSGFSIFSTAFVMTSCWAMVVFLCSPVATRAVDPASSCRARAPAVTTHSNESRSLLRSIISNLPSLERSYDLFGSGTHVLQTRALCHDDAPQAFDGGHQLVVDDHEIVLGAGLDLLTSHLQPSLDRPFAVLTATA